MSEVASNFSITLFSREEVVVIDRRRAIGLFEILRLKEILSSKTRFTVAGLCRNLTGLPPYFSRALRRDHCDFKLYLSCQYGMGQGVCQAKKQHCIFFEVILRSD